MSRRKGVNEDDLFVYAILGVFLIVFVCFILYSFGFLK